MMLVISKVGGEALGALSELSQASVAGRLFLNPQSLKYTTYLVTLSSSDVSDFICGIVARL